MRNKKLQLKDRLIISIDTNNKNEVVSLCKKISGRVSTIKIGLELIYSVGLSIINTVKSFGYKVMLDAKLMDIPNTVNGAVAAISKLGVSAVTMHTLSGRQVLISAQEVIEKQVKLESKLKPLLFGVTILTSLDDDDLKTLGFKENFFYSVLNLSRIAVESGLDGIICSPNEVKIIRENLGDDFYIATPGIRLSEDSAGDQKRINTPEEAILKGADFIIMGRSITTKKDIARTIESCLEEIERSL